MVKVILTIDEMVDEGIILTTELDEILERIDHRGSGHVAREEVTVSSSEPAQA